MEVKKCEENCHPDDEPIVMTPGTDCVAAKVWNDCTSIGGSLSIKFEIRISKFELCLT